MPDVRIMTWNIQKLGWGRMSVNGLPEALADVIVQSQADICVIEELANVFGPAVMQSLSIACNAHALAGGALFRGWAISEGSGGERFGFLVRDLAEVRPLTYAPAAPAAAGTQVDPLRSAQQGTWTTWPAAFGAPLPNPLPNRPVLPLANIYAVRTRPGGGAPTLFNFAAMPPNANGYALGIGSRLPAMALFEVQGAGAASYILPIIAVHTAAGGNAATRGQIKQVPLLHICQLFGNPVGAVNRERGYVHVNGGWRSVDNLMILGDFNIDYASAIAADIRAIEALTPTRWQDVTGSANPPGLPGNAGAVPAAPPPLAFAPPSFQHAGQAVSPISLKAANTRTGTFAAPYDALKVYPPYTTACFDNAFYGGVEASNAIVVAPGPDAAVVIDIPAEIVPSPVARSFNVAQLAASYAALVPPRRSADSLVLMLAGGIPDGDERLIGARLVTDHLPVVISVPFP